MTNIPTYDSLTKAEQHELLARAMEWIYEPYVSLFGGEPHDGAPWKTYRDGIFAGREFDLEAGVVKQYGIEKELWA